MTKVHPLVIIGSGPAAWTAAIYAGRAALSPIVLAGEQSGGQLILTTEVENYPGFPQGILGPELMANMRKQAERQGVKIIDKDAVKLETQGSNLKTQNQNLKLKTSGGEEIVGRAVIIATGAKANTLGLPGEERLMGRGVGTCAVCDAPFYRGKDMVLVIGGGDSAAEEAAELSKFVKKVVILLRKDVMRASAVMQNRIRILQNVEIWYKSEAREFLGDKRLEKVRIARDGKEEVVAADGVFYAIGHTPATSWMKNSGVELDEKGYIVTNLTANWQNSKLKAQNSNPQLKTQSFPTATTIEGVFAAGDCVDARYRQAVTAAGYGCMAALDAQRWLETTSEK